MLKSRLIFAVPLCWLAAACGDGAAGADGTGGTASVPGSAGTAGTAPVVTTGGAGDVGATAPTGGTSSVPVGGTGTTTSGGSAPIPLAGSGQAVGGGDQGALFPPGGAVPIMPVATGGSAGGGAGGSTSTIPGDGKSVTSMIRGSINGTAVFSQKGEDVTVVVNLTSGCADGKHMFQVYDGDSCDNASTEGMPWSPRGTGLGPAGGIQCSGGKGMMMDVRSGADKTKNLTVGDHVLATDVSTHVVIVSDEKDPTSRASCGNFF